MQEDAGDLDFTYRQLIEIFLWMTMIACSFGLLFVDRECYVEYEE